MTPTHTDYEATMTSLLSVSGLDYTASKEEVTRKKVDQARAILWIIGPQLTPKSKQTIQEWITSVWHYVNNMLIQPSESSGQLRCVIQHTRLACHQRVKESKERVVWEWVKG